ncbi:MAG TPA: hypothetical protein VFO34_13155, partial [Candidatus Acidoferrales bacterium]|nr:hypothetical protein [Candidatus Acidoferrales bacterium]
MNAKKIYGAALAVILCAGVAGAQGRRGNPDDQQQNPGGRRGGNPAAQQAQQQQGNANAQDQQRRLPPPEEKQSVTHHTARVGGQTINYTATAGDYVIKDDEGNPKTTFFYVAYTKDDPGDISKRPVSFSYNGGPGSASLFVHLGFGPR